MTLLADLEALERELRERAEECRQNAIKKGREGFIHWYAKADQCREDANRLATLRAGVVGEVTDAMVERAANAPIPDDVRDRYGYRRGMTVRRFIAEAERGDADAVIRAALTAALRAELDGVTDSAPAAWWQHCVANGEWYRDDGRTHIAIRLADGADLSCKAMREDAMRAALNPNTGESNGN